ncbi:MAG: hypothetical protein QW728_00530 [Thermoplasmata archaeon]
MYKGDLLYDNSLTKEKERVPDRKKTNLYILATGLLIVSITMLIFGIYVVTDKGITSPSLIILLSFIPFGCAAAIYWLRGRQRAPLCVYEYGIDIDRKKNFSDKSGEFIPFKNIVRISIIKTEEEEPRIVIEYKPQGSQTKIMSREYKKSYFLDFKLFMNCIEGHVAVEKKGIGDDVETDDEKEKGKEEEKEEDDKEVRKEKDKKRKEMGSGKRQTESAESSSDKDKKSGKEQSQLLKIETHSKTIYKDTNIICPKCKHKFTKTFEVDHLVNRSATISCPKCKKIFERKFDENEI